tara:strand:+ start:392 stop:580 length:189 start_codon:yes stop_codon:yes gene_type:complete
MYRIITVKNYRNLDIHKLQLKEKENWIFLTTVTDLNLKKFKDKGLNVNNSEDIAKYRKYNNL